MERNERTILKKRMLNRSRRINDNNDKKNQTDRYTKNGESLMSIYSKCPKKNLKRILL